MLTIPNSNRRLLSYEASVCKCTIYDQKEALRSLDLSLLSGQQSVEYPNVENKSKNILV